MISKIFICFILQLSIFLLAISDVYTKVPVPDPTFDIGYGFTNSFDFPEMNIQPDGKILIASNFTYFNGVPYANFIRLNKDGTVDTSFIANNKLSIVPLIFIVQPDNKIILGGNNLIYNGYKYLIRLNQDGSLDTNFKIAFSGDQNITSALIAKSGKIYLAGQIKLNSFTNPKNLIRLNSDGTLDNTYYLDNIFYTDYGGSRIDGLIEQSDGKILIGTNFNVISDENAPTIFRVNENGLPDETFNNYVNFLEGSFHYFSCMSLQTDNKIILGGAFFNNNHQQECRHLLRLNQDGSVDNSFKFKTYLDGSSVVSTIDIQKDGKIILGGVILLDKDSIYRSLLRVNPDATVDTTFDSNNNIFYGWVQKIILYQDSSLFVCGSIQCFNNTYASGLCKLLLYNISSDNLSIDVMNKSKYFAGSIIPVPYKITGSFDIDNDFIAQLNEPSQQYYLSFNIGKIKDNKSGVILGKIPDDITFDTNYTISLVSTHPILQSKNNSKNILIAESKINGNSQSCSKYIEKYSSPNISGVAHQWSVTGGNILGSSTNNNISVTWGTSDSATVNLVETLTPYTDTSRISLPVKIMQSPILSDILGLKIGCTNSLSIFYTTRKQGTYSEWCTYNGYHSYQSDTSISVKWLSPGTGTVTLIQHQYNTGCTDSVSLIINIYGNPLNMITGPKSVISDSIYTYYAPADSLVIYSWTVFGGKILGPSDKSSIKVVWDTVKDGTIYLFQVNSVANCSSNTFMPVNISRKVSVEEDNKVLFIYPNPANDIINISFSNDNINISELQLINPLGETIFIWKNQSHNTSLNLDINTENYSSGLYLLLIKNKNSYIRKKIIIKH